MHLIKRNTCRACGSRTLTPVIDLGLQYLQGSFVKPGKGEPPSRRIPTTLVRCDPWADEKACGLLQAAFSVPPAILYSAYWYRSGTNSTMRRHLGGVVEEALVLTRWADRLEPATVLDIGCNDGTLLGHYPAGYDKFGIDPCDIAAGIEPRAGTTIIQGYFPSERLAGRNFDIITSIAMFYDLEDPVAFAREVKWRLATDGIWVLEMSYMPAMLAANAYDTICHEHLEYYSLSVVEYILRQAGLKAFKVSRNQINGGSFRVHAAHAACTTYDRPDFEQEIAAMRQAEFELELDTGKPYGAFQDRINTHKQELSALLTRLAGEGMRVHVYGASTKGNTLLQWCGVDKTIIEYAADRNPEKYGARTLGTDIPIVSEAESRAMNPDYYLVLPWHFKEEFLERERGTLDRGVGFIFPLPKIEIIRKPETAP